ncbi:helix-turn-helix domain-containing protein [Olivibacter domesticus]|uniref:AraC-type DNA-binding protein n=1 Tax=Olivibacter domesticus TaxID=407022 RepID=A0A1H7HCH2_OLID1|nr:helix-turn-helix domain-containing protein [Olivibacter domesticus]SEK47954.1 AraC-type DNA-binding protein [Olivibacter domesticus]
MERFNSYHSLNIFRYHSDTWEFTKHNHNFYELIFVEQGSGNHILNDALIPYSPGDVFLLRPEDAHSFEIAAPSQFIFMKFTEQLFIEKLEGSKTAKWLNIVKTLLQAPSMANGDLITDNSDREKLKNLLQILLSEFSNKCSYSRELLLELFGAVMMMIAKAQATTQFGEQCPINTELDKLSQILSYTRLHALDAEKMRVEHIAKHFAMSANYISIYVKKHSGLSIQQHIIQTKLKVADQLLKNGRYNVNEIASRLGFTDASHFNKIYKKYNGTSPKSVQRIG